MFFSLIICLRFSRSKSIADFIGKRYGDRVLKNVRKFEILNYQFRKCQLDLELLNTCHNYNVIPNFLRSHIMIKTLTDSVTYSRCQQLLLSEEVRCKKRCLRQLTSLNLIVSDRNYSIIYHSLILCMCHHCLWYEMIKQFARTTKYMVENCRS